jgi:anti-sigma factor RsiW
MSSLDRLSPRDLEDLSAYLDGELPTEQAARLEARLQADRSLQEAAQELRATAKLLASLPQVRPPRNFTLTPETAGVRQRPRSYPGLQLATALASLAFLLCIGLDAVMGRIGGFGAMAPAPAAQELRSAPLIQEAPQAPAPTAALAPAPSATLGVETYSLEAPPGQATEAAAKVAGEATATAPPTAEPTQLAAAPPSLGGAAPLASPTPCGACALPTTLPTEAQANRSGIIVATTPTPTPEPAPLAVAATTPAVVAREVGEEGIPLSPIRMAEIGLGLAVVLLGGLTIWARRRPG